MKKILAELFLDLAADKENRNKLMIAVFSIVIGLLFIMAAPIVFLNGLKELGTPSISFNYSENELPSELSQSIAKAEADGKAIEDALTAIGCRDRTIKAQLIYMSYFDDVKPDDIDAYAAIFITDDDRILIDSINSNYDLDIDFNEFSRMYVLVMNANINEYMFNNAEQKNSDDLAAWAINAYSMQWAFKENYFGDMDSETHCRCTDNIGLIMGYIRYDPHDKVFTADKVSLYYAPVDSLESMPDVKGIGVHGNSGFGVYIGNGEVIYSSAIGGIVREPIDNGSWDEWCIFDAVSYPQEVYDKIEEIRNKGEDDNESGTEE